MPQLLPALAPPVPIKVMAPLPEVTEPPDIKIPDPLPLTLPPVPEKLMVPLPEVLIEPPVI